MTTRLRPLAALALALFIAFHLVGCTGSPPARFYTLSSLAVVGEAGEPPDAPSRQLIGVGPVALARYLKHPAVTTRSGPNTVSRSEMNRWGGSLSDETTRVLVENLGHLMPGEKYLVLPWMETAVADYRVQLNITRFEKVSEGPVVLNATWMVFAGRHNSPLSSGDTSITEPVNAPGYAALADAMSRALAELSRRIADELATVAGSG